MAIVGCKYDTVDVEIIGTRVHKEIVGIVLIICDFSSVVIMMYWFGAMGLINNEYLVVMDDLRVQVKDFSCKIDNVILDRYS